MDAVIRCWPSNLKSIFEPWTRQNDCLIRWSVGAKTLCRTNASLLPCWQSLSEACGSSPRKSSSRECCSRVQAHVLCWSIYKTEQDLPCAQTEIRTPSAAQRLNENCTRGEWLTPHGSTAWVPHSQRKCRPLHGVRPHGIVPSNHSGASWSLLSTTDKLWSCFRCLAMDDQGGI